MFQIIQRYPGFFAIIGLAVVTVCFLAPAGLFLTRQFGPPDPAATAQAEADRAAAVLATEAALNNLATDTALAAKAAEIEATQTTLAVTPPATASERDLTWDGLRLEVTAVERNAWPLIQAQNANNEPPEIDWTMLLITLRVSNVEGSPETPLSLRESDFQLIDSRGRTYKSFERSCQVIPDELDVTLGLSHTADGNVCFQVPESGEGFQLIYQPFDLPTTTLDLATIGDVPPLPALVSAPARTPNGLQLDLLELDYDAWPLLKAHNHLNDPPQADRTMLLLTVRATNVAGSAETPIRLWDSDFHLIGSRNVVYETFEVSCGVTPDELNSVVPLGGSTSGKLCFQISPSESDFKLIYQPYDLAATILDLPER